MDCPIYRLQRSTSPWFPNQVLQRELNPWIVSSGIMTNYGLYGLKSWTTCKSTCLHLLCMTTCIFLFLAPLHFPFENGKDKETIAPLHFMWWRQTRSAPPCLDWRFTVPTVIFTFWQHVFQGCSALFLFVHYKTKQKQCLHYIPANKGNSSS